jgi:LysM repeat protein
MTITHEEAHKLIQFKADNALKESDKNLLDAHLSSCIDCKSYEASISELESILRPLMQRKWNQHPLPLSKGKTASSGSKKIQANIFLATRIVAMGVICITFLFNIWQSTQPGGKGTLSPSADIPLIPTPSLQSTQTMMTSQKCESIQYIVQNHDTLESIANQFSIPVESLKKANNLMMEKINASTSLSIPVCNPTPAGTPNIIRTKFTPLLGSNTLTPMNSPTQ